MNFRFSTFNHCPDGRRCIEDLTRIISAQLRALGHATSETEEADFATDDGVNVVYESFADAGTIPAIELACGRGARFVFIATEEPTAGGCFNGRLDSAMRERQEAFVEAAPLAEAIWHLVPGGDAAAWYGRLAPAAYVEIGYAEELVYRGPPREPDRLFGFYGQLTPRRARVFDRVAEITGQEVLVLPFITHGAAERDEAMRRARYVLQVRAHDSMPIISSSRCATALNLGRAIIGEPHGVPGPWGDIVWLAADDDRFYAMIADAADGRSGVTHAAQLRRFERLLPPRACLGPALAHLEASTHPGGGKLWETVSAY